MRLKVSELNLQSELNQAAEAVGASDLAEAARVHSSAWCCVVCVIEDVEHLCLEDQLGRFKQGEVLGRVEVHVLERGIMQIVSSLVSYCKCSGLREGGRVEPLLQGFSPSPARQIRTRAGSLGPLISPSGVGDVSIREDISRRTGVESNDASNAPPPQHILGKGIGAIQESLALSDRQLIDTAEYEHLRPVVIRRTVVQAHVVKINWSAGVWVRLPIQGFGPGVRSFEAQPRRHLLVEFHLQTVVAGRH